MERTCVRVCGCVCEAQLSPCEIRLTPPPHTHTPHSPPLAMGYSGYDYDEYVGL